MRTRLITVLGQRIGLWLAAALVVSTAVAQDKMQYPVDVAAAADGTVYVADKDLPGIWKLKDGKRSVFFKGSSKFETPLHAIRCIAVDPQGRVLAADSSNCMVYRFEAEGADPKPIMTGRIGNPMGIAVNKAGEVFVSDLELGRIYKISGALDGSSKPELFAQVVAPRGIWCDSQDRLWVVSGNKDPLRRFDAAGKEEVIVKDRPFRFPCSVVVSASGEVHVADSYSDAIWQVAQDGTATKWHTGSPLEHPVGMALHGDLVLVVDSKANKVFQISKDGKIEEFAAN